VSGFAALQDATLAMRNVLRDAITNSPEVSLSGIPIDLRSPREMKDANGAQGVSLWLYRAMRFAELVNHTDLPIDPELVPRRSLPLELSYLITPINQDAERRQVLAGRVVQALNDSSSIVVGSTELRVHLSTIPLEEHVLIWGTLGVPPILSLPYVVQVVTIDSALPARKAPRVLWRDAKYEQIVGVGSAP
jgi:Pvc16 N-terminal domain